MQISAIPTGPRFYQPVSAVPPVAPVVGRPGGGQDGQKLRAATPPGVGSLLDIEA